MKRLYGSVVLFLYYFSAFGQVTFTQLPRDLQLYPRDAANQARVTVSGQTTTAGYTQVAMQMLREGVLATTVSQTLSPAETSAPFSLSAVIKAEPAEYSFRVFLYKATDSILVAERKRVVCGDVYILHGQSNALALGGLDTYYSFNFDDKYLRNATYPYQSANIPGEMSWYAAKDPYGSVGGFGLTLQRLILQTYGIPTVVLNGAFGGTGIAALSARDPGNHANLDTFYGRLLFRAQWAGVDKQVKAIIWKQGEAEAGEGPDGYPALFTQLYNQLREDYNADARIYVGQINILDKPQPGAGMLRDFQRRTKRLYKNVESIATVGAKDYDGIHYAPEGHQQLAFEQFRQIARDLYGAKDTLQINSPDLKKAFYNTAKDSITLVFDDDMRMVWKDTAYYNFATGARIGGRELKDYFYLDGQTGWLTGGSTNGNRVVLRLKQAASAKSLTYLPAYFTADALSDYFNGPTLRNERGMRAFSFDGVSIADVVPSVTTLAATGLSDKQIQLSWTAPADAQTQIVERADGTPTTFRQIAVLRGPTPAYTDDNLPDPLGTYFYRLRVLTGVSESGYSNVATARPLVLGIEPTGPLVRLYPNPLAGDRLLRVEADQTTFTSLVVRDLVGRAVKTWQGTARNTVALALDDLEAGLYIADLQTATGQTLRRKVVIR